MRIAKCVIAASLVALAFPAVAQVHVRGYTKHDGTYVPPHERSAPNTTRMDNYSTRGNVNPYAGQAGTVDPYATPKPRSSYGNSYGTQKPSNDDTTGDQ